MGFIERPVGHEGNDTPCQEREVVTIRSMENWVAVKIGDDGDGALERVRKDRRVVCCGRNGRGSNPARGTTTRT